MEGWKVTKWGEDLFHFSYMTSQQTYTTFHQWRNSQGGSGGRVPLETSHRKISADLAGKRGKEKMDNSE